MLFCCSYIAYAVFVHANVYIRRKRNLIYYSLLTVAGESVKLWRQMWIQIIDLLLRFSFKIVSVVMIQVNIVFKYMNKRTLSLSPLSLSLSPRLCLSVCLSHTHTHTHTHTHIYIYIYYFKKKTIFGHIRIIDLFPSCQDRWYELKLQKNFNRTSLDPTRKWNQMKYNQTGEREKERKEREREECHFTNGM